MFPSISEQCRTCLSTLRSIVSLLTEPGNQGLISLASVNDELERFSLWTGNIGALHESSSTLSLEMRLQEAEDVLIHVQGLLDDLKDVTEDLLQIISGVRQGLTETSTLAELHLSSSAEDGAEPELDELNEEIELLREIGGCITNLFRVSSLIRQASPTDLFSKALTRNRYKFNDQFDIAHVGEKFPKLAEEHNEWLRNRLGRAITQRRHYLSYIQDHRDKLAGLLEEDTSQKTIYVGQEVQSKVQCKAPKVEAYQDSASRPSTFFTKASTLNPARITPQMLRVKEDSDPEDDARSYTTISRSIDGEPDGATTRLPKLQDLKSGNQKEIECPFCFRMQKFKTERAWRRHVFSDLRPYICTFSGCDATFFGDINQWFQHEMQTHRVNYTCMLCKEKTFQIKEKYLSHVHKIHPDIVQGGDDQQLTEIARKALKQIPAQDCPCCSDWDKRLRQRSVSKGANLEDHGDIIAVIPTVFKRHLAAHLEGLAAFAIAARSSTGNEVATDAAIEDDDQESQQSLESSLSFRSTPSSLETDFDIERAEDNSRHKPLVRSGSVPSTEASDRVQRRQPLPFGAVSAPSPTPIPLPTLVDARLEGKRIKGDSSPEIYLILERKARHITNPEVYDAMFGDPPWYFDTAAQSYVESLPKGKALDSTTPLVKGVGAPIYLMDGGKKRWIVNPDVFIRYGFNWGKVLEIGDRVDEIPTGKDIK